MICLSNSKCFPKHVLFIVLIFIAHDDMYWRCFLFLLWHNVIHAYRFILRIEHYYIHWWTDG